MEKRIVGVYLIQLIGLSLLLTACNNDLDVIDDYQETPIIYSLLNAYDSVQYVRVEKAFLGEGNALLMAQSVDSLYYDTADVSVSLVKYKNSVLVDTMKLKPTDQIAKDEGLFADYPHLLYRSDGLKLLDTEANYKLYFHNKKSGVTITAVTPVVKQVTLNPLLPSPLPNPSSTINFASDDPLIIGVVTPAKGKFLSLVIRINYVDSIPGALQSQHRTLNYSQPVMVAATSTGGQNFEYQIDGDLFYQFVGRNVKKDPNIYRDASLFSIDFIFTVGAEEFYTYYVVNLPSTSINDNIPEYTNLSSGKGIFSSRSIRIYPNKKLNNASRDSLINGQYTNGRFQ